MTRIYIFILLFFFLFSNSITAQEKDTPRTGEGIHAFLRRNKRTTSGDYNKFLLLNKDKFGKNNSLLKGISYQLPPLPAENKKPVTPPKVSDVSSKAETYKKKTNRLFGKKYEEYPIVSDRLRGACFYLSSGHGGPDSGAVGKIDGHEVHEDEYAYDITLRLARNLLMEGATVYVIIQDAKDGIRDDTYLANSKSEMCMGKAIPLNQVARLKQRSSKINELYKKSGEKYKRAVFIHLDSRSKKSQLDVFFYYAPKSIVGERLANSMRNTFREHYAKHQPNRGFSGTVSSRSLYVLTNTTPVGIFAELGNIQNSFDQRRFLQSDNRQALANWMCRGFIKDYENSK